MSPASTYNHLRHIRDRLQRQNNCLNRVGGQRCRTIGGRQVLAGVENRELIAVERFRCRTFEIRMHHPLGQHFMMNAPRSRASPVGIIGLIPLSHHPIIYQRITWTRVKSHNIAIDRLRASLGTKKRDIGNTAYIDDRDRFLHIDT